MEKPIEKKDEKKIRPSFEISKEAHRAFGEKGFSNTIMIRTEYAKLCSEEIIEACKKDLIPVEFIYWLGKVRDSENRKQLEEIILEDTKIPKIRRSERQIPTLDALKKVVKQINNYQ